MDKRSELRVALSHDWLNGMRGGEKCLEVLCELYPRAPIYTLFYEPAKITSSIQTHPVHESFLARFPLARKNYRHYLPLYPAAVQSFRLKDYDLVVSTSHCAAKGIAKPCGAKHLCYCFTPMRYAWGFFEEYFGQRPAWQRAGIRYWIDRLKRWDLSVNRDIDSFVAISKHVQERIRRYYERESDVIYPPVDTEFYSPSPQTAREDFYLVVSALVPYKRVDLAVRAFTRLGKRLVVVGDGPLREQLKLQAGPQVLFLGWQPDETLRDLYRRARALVFPGEEDFGIVPVEMQSCGGSVIAYRKGGALETVNGDETGVFFSHASEEGLCWAVTDFEKKQFSAERCRINAERFSRARFKKELSEKIRRLMN